MPPKRKQALQEEPSEDSGSEEELPSGSGSDPSSDDSSDSGPSASEDGALACTAAARRGSTRALLRRALPRLVRGEPGCAAAAAWGTCGHPPSPPARTSPPRRDLDLHRPTHSHTLAPTPTPPPTQSSTSPGPSFPSAEGTSEESEDDEDGEAFDSINVDFEFFGPQVQMAVPVCV